MVLQQDSAVMEHVDNVGMGFPERFPRDADRAFVEGVRLLVPPLVWIESNEVMVMGTNASSSESLTSCRPFGTRR